MALTTDTALLNILTPAAREANRIWATNQVAEALSYIRKVLPHNPDLPPELKQWLQKTT